MEHDESDTLRLTWDSHKPPYTFTYEFLRGEWKQQVLDDLTGAVSYSTKGPGREGLCAVLKDWMADGASMDILMGARGFDSYGSKEKCVDVMKDAGRYRVTEIGGVDY